VCVFLQAYDAFCVALFVPLHTPLFDLVVSIVNCLYIVYVHIVGLIFPPIRFPQSSQLILVIVSCGKKVDCIIRFFKRVLLQWVQRVFLRIIFSSIGLLCCRVLFPIPQRQKKTLVASL